MVINTKTTQTEYAAFLLAKESEGVGLMIDGHTHTFLNEPVVVKNKKGDDVLINQGGWAAINLGRLGYEFLSKKKKNLINAHRIVVGKN